MNLFLSPLTIFLFLVLLTLSVAGEENIVISLPAPILEGAASVEEAINMRRSLREFSEDALTIQQISKLLWAAQGITGEDGMKRTAPSAGATYPMEVYILIGDVEGIAGGLYHYLPRQHQLVMLRGGELRSDLEKATLKQGMLQEAPISIILTALYNRTTRHYGERGVRYVHMEAGHIGQNVHLQAEAMGLGTCMIGAFQDQEVREFLGLRIEEEVPLYIMPVGVKP